MRLFCSGLMVLVVSFFSGNVAEAQWGNQWGRFGGGGQIVSLALSNTNLGGNNRQVGAAIALGVLQNAQFGGGFGQFGGGFQTFGGGFHPDFQGYNYGGQHFNPVVIGRGGVPVTIPTYQVPVAGFNNPYSGGGVRTYTRNVYPSYTIQPQNRYYHYYGR